MTSINSIFVPAYQDPRGSAIREMAKWAADPSFISFAGGYPAADAFDVKGIHSAAERAWSANAAECLQYGSSEGIASLRSALTHLSAQRGIEVTPDRLVVTTGSQQGLDFLIRATLSPDDTVLLERPTYPGALQAFRLAGARVIGIDGDAEGIDVALARKAIVSAPSRPKLIYVVPTFANPSGVTMSEAKRMALIALAVEYGILLIEDDPYSALRFGGEPVPSLVSLSAGDPGASEVVVHLSTLSKIAVPSLRVGWMVASPEVVRRCVMAKQVSDMCTSAWNQHIAASYLRSPDFSAHLPRIIETYKLRASALAAAVESTFDGEWHFTMPEGGMFLWVQLPRDVDAAGFLQIALEEKVLFVPGHACFSDSPVRSSLRLSFSSSAPEVIREGVTRLRRAYDRYMESAAA